MKRGRQPLRKELYGRIVEILGEMNSPLTIFFISKEISQRINKKISWNTIQKYVQELVESGKIQAIQLPHSKEKNKLGLVVYTLKK